MVGFGRSILVLGVLGILLAACSSEEQTAAPVSEADASTTPIAKPAPKTDAVDADAPCNDLTVDGPLLPIEASAEPDGGLSALTGGTIVDGTYVLAWLADYNLATSTPSAVRETMRLKNGVWESYTEAGNGKTYRASFAYKVTGAEIRRTTFCTTDEHTRVFGPSDYETDGKTFIFEDIVPGHRLRSGYTRLN